ncbi:hypothetical protein E5288_WYG009759 [Bos mutus]|uniref:Uncharacterized protein n=1 Tax=Bos mutus TaxID=72004 RepID=A0A6B0R4Y1_9CETA|nr:hypothetical protein [Bos mutus]
MPEDNRAFAINTENKDKYLDKRGEWFSFSDHEDEFTKEHLILKSFYDIMSMSNDSEAWALKSDNEDYPLIPHNSSFRTEIQAKVKQSQEAFKLIVSGLNTKIAKCEMKAATKLKMCNQQYGTSDN